MTHSQELQDFLSRFFGVFIVEFFLSCLTIGGAVSLVFSTYLRSPEGNRHLSLIVLAAAGLVSAASHIAVVRGHAWGVRGVIAVTGASVLAVLPCYGYGPHMGAYVAVLLFGLLALLIVNSQRYREMRGRLAGYRQQRRANRQTAAGPAKAGGKRHRQKPGM